MLQKRNNDRLPRPSGLLRNVDDALCHLLRLAHIRASQLVDARLHSIGVTGSQLAVLQTVAALEREGATLAKVATALRLREESVYISLRVLRDKQRDGGALVTNGSTEDRRERALRLTPVGRRVVESALLVDRRIRKELRGMLSRNEADQLERLLTRLLRKMDG